MTENEFKMRAKDIKTYFEDIASVLYNSIDICTNEAEDTLKNDKLPKEGIAYAEGLIFGFKEARGMIERVQAAITFTSNFVNENENFFVGIAKELNDQEDVKKSEGHGSPLLTDYQQNEICYVIREWYLKWKDQLVDYSTKTHRLGSAKEELKQIVCDWKDHRSKDQRIIGLEDQLVKMKQSVKDDK